MLFSLNLTKTRQCKGVSILASIRSYSVYKNDKPSADSEYSDYAKYPPIEPTDEKYLKDKEKKKWYDKIKRLKTIEEKLFEVNVPRYYGWKCLLLKEGQVPYNSLEFTKFITRTHLIKTNELPGYFKDSSGRCSELAKRVKSRVEDLLSDCYTTRFKYMLEDCDSLKEDSEFTNNLVNELNRIILKVYQEDNPELIDKQVDYSPRIEAFWHLGYLRETYVQEKYTHGLPPEEIPEEYLGRPSDKYIQYIGKPILQLRSENPLSPILKHDEGLYLQYPVPYYEYDPFVVFGYEMVRRHVTNIPGFWPGEPREFSFLSYHDTSHIKYRPEVYGEEDTEETEQCHGILSSFAWLMSLSSYQGFSTYHDPTYPTVTQTVLTNGREFSFVVYQLNTTELYHEDSLLNPRCNICWITPKKPLYEVSGGKIKDVNMDVLKYLVQFYMNKTKALENQIAKPYLDENVSVIAKYTEDEKRAWLEREFKHFSSNRPRHRVDYMYEVADYERIYKVMFRRRNIDKRSRPFELRQNPYHRKMNEYKGRYIAKRFREDLHLPKYKQKKFHNTYFPE